MELNLIYTSPNLLGPRFSNSTSTSTSTGVSLFKNFPPYQLQKSPNEKQSFFLTSPYIFLMLKIAPTSSLSIISWNPYSGWCSPHGNLSLSCIFCLPMNYHLYQLDNMLGYMFTVHGLVTSRCSKKFNTIPNTIPNLMRILTSQNECLCSRRPLTQSHIQVQIDREGGWRLQAPPMCSIVKLENWYPKFLTFTAIKWWCH